MLRRIISIFLVFILTLTLPALAEEPVDNVVRLHVIANDDSADAQALKLEIRDSVLALAQETLSACQDSESAWTELNAHLTDFLAAAAARMRELGQNFPVSVQAGVFEFPDRDYDGFILPAGDYRALRVIIGDGQGQNWWCVLFPTLCLPGDEYHSILADWLRDVFGGNA